MLVGWFVLPIIFAFEIACLLFVSSYLYLKVCAPNNIKLNTNYNLANLGKALAIPLCITGGLCIHQVLAGHHDNEFLSAVFNIHFGIWCMFIGVVSIAMTLHATNKLVKFL
jgi:hypothetical protein